MLTAVLKEGLPRSRGQPFADGSCPLLKSPGLVFVFVSPSFIITKVLNYLVKIKQCGQNLDLFFNVKVLYFPHSPDPMAFLFESCKEFEGGLPDIFPVHLQTHTCSLPFFCLMEIGSQVCFIFSILEAPLVMKCQSGGSLSLCGRKKQAQRVEMTFPLIASGRCGATMLEFHKSWLNSH